MTLFCNYPTANSPNQITYPELATNFCRLLGFEKVVPLRQLSKAHRLFVNLLLIKKINSGEIKVTDLQIRSCEQLKGYFGKTGSKIEHLDLGEFSKITDLTFLKPYK